MGVQEAGCSFDSKIITFFGVTVWQRSVQHFFTGTRFETTAYLGGLAFMNREEKSILDLDPQHVPARCQRALGLCPKITKHCLLKKQTKSWQLFPFRRFDPHPSWGFW